jgi:DNA polymerase-3 subunit epsilon
MLSDFSDMPSQQRDRFLRVIRDEAAVLSLAVREAAALSRTICVSAGCWRKSSAANSCWWLRDASPSDARASGAALAVKTEQIDDGLWLRVDSFGLLQALRYLALRLQDEYEVREVRLSLTAQRPVGAARSVVARHLHEQRSGHDLVAGPDEYRPAKARR